MSVLFKLSPKTNNLANPPETRYYPRAIHRNEVDLDKLADILSERSHLNRSVCHAVIIGLSDVISQSLKEGDIVRLGDFGTFQISIQGKGTENPEALGKNLIQSAKVVYRPGKTIKNALRQLVYERKR